MGKRIGVLVLHGMGSQGSDPDKDTSNLDYSWPLYQSVLREMGYDMAHVSWREVLWSHVLQERQDAYLDKISHLTNGWGARGFVMRNLSDAASYRPLSSSGSTAALQTNAASSEDTYSKIHLIVDAALEKLAADIGPDGPIVILAHSLGGHIASNHIYDLQSYKKRNGAPMHNSPLRNMETVASIITFGCNIPVFVFSYAEDKIEPIENPGGALPKKIRQGTWWYNLYDRNDVLGYPLAPTGAQYRKMQQDGKLKDEPIAAGGWFKSWNPMSHTGYWKTKAVAQRIAKVLQKVDPGE